MNINVPSENSESETLLKVIGGVVFLLILIVIYMISRQYAKMQETIRRMEIQNEVAAKPQVVMETLSLEPVPMDVETPTTSAPAPSPPPPPSKKQQWKRHLKRDVNMGSTDLFHLHKRSNPKGSLKNCLEECDKRDNCKGIATDRSHHLCWGKTNLSQKSENESRKLYEKSEDGILSPWDGGTEWNIHPWNSSGAANEEAPKISVGGSLKRLGLRVSPSPPPPPSSNVSTNGRCGPEFNNTICPGKQCCSTSSWCAGTQGTKSDWCADKNGYKGRDGGKYDGKSN